MAFGEALQKARLELGWTQPVLADAIREATDGRIRLTPAEISRYERGKVVNPRLDLIRAAAKATRRPIDFFTEEEAAPSGDSFRNGASADVRASGGRRRGAKAGGEDVKEAA